MTKFVDCFMLMGTALSLQGQKLPEMGRPLLQDVFTTSVNLSLILQEFKIFENEHLEIEIGALLIQKWLDPRLGANIKTRKMAVNGQIWKPKIVNVNGERKNCKNEDTIFWRGFGDEGNILLSEKINLRSLCSWDYRKFPFDTQFCQLKFGSFRFPKTEVELFWDINPVQATTNLCFNNFDVTSIQTNLEVDVRSFGNFSTAVIQFTLKRNSQKHIFCVYLPLFVLTLLNYFSFWLKRFTRLFLNLIILSFTLVFYYFYTCLIHPTPYIKACDIFIFICNMFSLITLIETFFVDILCTVEETQFYLKKLGKLRDSVEFAMKLFYPLLYVSFLILYLFLFVK